MTTRKQKRKVPTKPTKLVDASQKGVIQSGSDVDYPYDKVEVKPEELTAEETEGKRVYRSLLKRIVPKFPIAKLEKMRLEDLEKFFENLPDMIQEEVIRRYKDISP